MLKKSKLSFLFLFFLIAGLGKLYSQAGFIHRQGKTIVDGSNQPINLRGVNLGGWLLWEGWIYGGGLMSETDIMNRMSKITGKTNAEQFHQQIYDNYITEDDIAAISQSCFNVVRIAFNHDLLEDDASPYIYKQSGWKILDSTLSWCEKHNVYAVLDMHGAPGGQSNLFVADPAPSGQQLWDIEDNKLRTIALWKAIADRYKNKTIIAGYDLLNEPAPGPWPFGNYFLVDIYTRIIQAIRTVDNNHMMILEGSAAATDFSMFNSTLLDNNMSYSFHIYTWFGEDPKAGVAAYKSLIDNNNVPLWCGEWGENTTAILDTTKRALQDPLNELSGWSFWTWKKVPSTNSQPYFGGIQASLLWMKLTKWISDSTWNPKPSYNEAIQGMNEFINAVKYKNTIKGTALTTLLSPCAATSLTDTNINNELKVLLFPNPAKDILTVNLSNNNNEIYYSIYNVIGGKITEGIVSDNLSVIDVSNYSNGMYFLKLSDGKSETTKKFLVGK